MKRFLIIASLLVSSFATAQENRESGGGGGGATKLYCHDQFTEKYSTIFLRADVVNENLLANVEVTNNKRHPGVTFGLKSMPLKKWNMTGVEVASAGVHASKWNITPDSNSVTMDFSIIVTLGAEWAETMSYSVGMIQFYGDEAGGGIPTFKPNMYCQIQ